MIKFKMSHPLYKSAVYIHRRGPKQVKPEYNTILNTIHQQRQKYLTLVSKNNNQQSTQPTQKKKNLLRPKSPIIILLFRTRINFSLRLRRFTIQHMNRILIQRIDILFIRRDLRFYLATAFARGDRTESFSYCVVAFCTPRNIVDVGELKRKRY